MSRLITMAPEIRLFIKKTARTGDSTQILPVLILLIAASAALAALES